MQNMYLSLHLCLTVSKFNQTFSLNILARSNRGIFSGSAFTGSF